MSEDVCDSVQTAAFSGVLSPELAVLRTGSRCPLVCRRRCEPRAVSNFCTDEDAQPHDACEPH